MWVVDCGCRMRRHAVVSAEANGRCAEDAVYESHG